MSLTWLLTLFLGWNSLWDSRSCGGMSHGRRASRHPQRGTGGPFPRRTGGADVGLSRGYAQANVLAIPREQAFDLLLFAQRNPKSVSHPGGARTGEITRTGPLLAGGDIRTDVPKYTVYRDGEKVDEPRTSPATGAMTWSRS